MKLAENMKKGFPSKGIRKTPTRKILTHQTPPAPPPPPLENPTRKITTQKILTWNIPTHGFNHSHSSFQIFCFFIIVAVIIDIT